MSRREIPELVRRCQLGEAGAWQALYREHAPLVARFVMRMVGRDGPVEDLVQQVFVAVMQSIGRFRGDAALTTWLYGVARHVTARHIRTEKRHRARDDRWAREDRIGGADTPSAHGRIAARESLSLLERAVLSLNEAHRVVWVMRELEGLSMDEIGHALDVRVGTVRSRLFNARKHVLEVVEAADGELAAWMRTSAEPLGRSLGTRSETEVSR